jgi:hypothetical protein
MKQVTYHPEDGRQVVFDVLSTNANGTVNIGLSDDPENPGKPLVVVGSCKITETVEIGSATAIADSVEESKAPAKPAKKKAGNAPETTTPPAPADGDQNPGDETPQ